MSVVVHRRISRRAGGYTLVEVVLAMSSATVLLVGMASSVYIASQSFDGRATANVRAQGSDMQADMLNDMSLATGFSVRNTTSATFTVPDRTSDGVEDSIAYRWTGSPNYQVTYALNGGTPVAILENVQSFQFRYTTRNMNGVTPPAPAVDSGLWGERWRLTGTFGTTTQGLLNQSNSSKYILCRYTLSETAKVRSIAVYFTSTGNSNVRCGVYAANSSNVPTTLLAQSAVVNITQTGWSTFDVPVTTLNPGEYFLAVSYKKNEVSHSYQLLGGNGYVKAGDGTSSGGFPSSWSGGTISLQKVSIYANYDLP